MTGLPLSRRVSVGDVPVEGREIEVVATEAERAALARENGLLGVEDFRALFEVRPAPRGGLSVTGEVRARVRQTCVVTLDPFEETIVEPIEIRYVAEGEPTAAAGPDEDEPDVLVDGVADLGALAAEFLTLGLDPYPRKPGAVFESGLDHDAAAVSPFAALKSVLGEGEP